jgi:hypothetical protein
VSVNKIDIVPIEENRATHKRLKMEDVTEVFQSCGHFSAKKKKITHNYHSVLK